MQHSSGLRFRFSSAFILLSYCIALHQLPIFPVHPQQNRQRNTAGDNTAAAKLISGSVNPLVGSTPMFTPMLMNACTPSHTPIPCATRAGKCRSRIAAWRPIMKARIISHENSTTTVMTPIKPSSSAITASKNRYALQVDKKVSRRCHPGRHPAIRPARTQSGHGSTDTLFRRDHPMGP